MPVRNVTLTELVRFRSVLPVIGTTSLNKKHVSRHCVVQTHGRICRSEELVLLRLN